MRNALFVLLMVSSLLPADAASQPAGPGPALSPEQIVRARQAAYGLSASTFAEMKQVADSGGQVKQLTFGSKMIARWATTLPTMFPEGTDVAPTNARPEVWTDRSEFNQRAQAYADAAAKLASAAQTGDTAAFSAQWTAVRATCQSCHDQFRRAAP